MSALFYIVMTVFVAFFVSITASQVRMILAAVKSEKVQTSYQKENDGFAVVRTQSAA